MRLTSQRPQVGQLTSSGERRRMPSTWRSSQATGTSSEGGAVSERRIVSPMPSLSSTESALTFLTVPWRSVPASVTPRWSGTCGSSRESSRFVRMVAGTSCTLAESTTSVNPRSSKWCTNETALCTSFSGWVRSSRASMARSREPAFTPMRMGMPASPAASMTASTLSKEPMFPGLTRRAEAPRRAASMARRWSKWMSATTGSGESAQTAPKPSSASAWGMATRMISQPRSASS